MPTDDLGKLIDLVAKRDRDAYRRLYNATSAKLFAVAIRIVKRQDLAEDVVQDVYLRMWHRAGDYRSNTASVLTWLIAITRNRAIDVLRKRGEAQLSDDGTQHEQADPTPDPFALASQSEELQRLAHCMEGLDADARESVLLAYYFGYTHTEIAERTSTPVGTVKSRIRRSLIRIKECLAK